MQINAKKLINRRSLRSFYFIRDFLFIYRITQRLFCVRLWALLHTSMRTSDLLRTSLVSWKNMVAVGS